MEELKINQKRRGVLDSKLCTEFSQDLLETIDYLPRICKMCKFTKKLFMWVFFFSVFLDTTMNKMLEYYIEEKKTTNLKNSIDVYFL